jgi:hypothetical protein
VKAKNEDLFERLGRSAFRRKFTLAERDVAYVREKGMNAIVAHAREIIAKRLAPALPANDGKQTPYRGHPVFIAQHATGTCCRSCLEKWHGLERARVLTPSEQDRVVQVIAEWIERQSAKN